MSSINIVKLNIGGTVFQTTESTLTKFDGFFKTILETGVPVKKDELGCIFIDRSSKHFDLVLNFMRDGKVVLPNSEQDVEEILNEAQYYLITGLIDLCSAKISERTESSGKINVIETDSEYLYIITYFVKPVLILHFPIQPNGSITFPPEFHVISFLKKYENHFDIYFKLFKDINDDRRSWSLHKKNYSTSGIAYSHESFLNVIEKSINNFLKH